MKDKFYSDSKRPNRRLILVALLLLLLAPALTDNQSLSCWAVTSKITRHSSSADFLSGQTKNIVVDSQGTVQLGRSADTLVEEFENVWSINSIVISGGTVFVGTSPNGGIYKYSLGKLTKIYPEQKTEKTKPDSTQTNDVNDLQAEKHLANEHIFAMATDLAGRLLAAISGEKAKLLRIEADKTEIISEPNDAKYIFAITTDDTGNIFLGTGPEGKLYMLDPLANAKEPQLVYDSLDKNILSLSPGPDGSLYAGSDSRGLVYKINPTTKTATVLFDSDLPEITALLFEPDSENGNLYAAATSAKIVQDQTKFAAQQPSAGRPELLTQPKDASTPQNTLKLEIANTKEKPDDNADQKQPPPPKPPKPTQASYVHKISREGFVTDIFSETAVFFCLARHDDNLLVGTGNSAQLFTIDPDLEQQAIIYQDEKASQITAIAVADNDIYLGTANPAKLIKLTDRFASEGTYTSPLIDAGQPAKWGNLQIKAEIPQGCKVLAASRSGNVKDINDPTFSQWTDPVQVTGPIQLKCPLGRFCQYKLIFKSTDGRQTPLVREVAAASSVPNLAPKVELVTVSRIETPDKSGVFKIGYKAKDDNNDKLIYKIDFRKIPRTNWIELKDQIEADNFEWDGRTVEDGRYEVRITASDERANTPTTKLNASRISEPVVVDNTAPTIKNYSLSQNGKTVNLKLKISDRLSVIGKLEYTVDSNAEWVGAIPDDLVYDSTQEDFNIVIEDLPAGEHVIAVKISDDLGNTMFKSFEINVVEK